MDWKSKLFQYSRQIAGNRWDAEDLAQDAYLKVMTAVRRDPSRPITNAYLYRVAMNTWIDMQRTRRLQTEPLNMAMDPPAMDFSLSTRELLELLAERLPPRMVVILLLMDVFDFTAKETAEFIASKEATVQVAIGRARKRLRQLAKQSPHDGPFSSTSKSNVVEERLDFEALVSAFRRRDPKAIYRAYIGLANGGIRLAGLQIGDGRLHFTFRDPDGNLFMVVS